MNHSFALSLFRAAFEVSLFVFVVLFALDQWLPNFATLSVRLDFFGFFVVFCGVVFFLLQFKKSLKH